MCRTGKFANSFSFFNLLQFTDSASGTETASYLSFHLSVGKEHQEAGRKEEPEMASKVSNFSDLIQRVTASCLLDPLSAVRRDPSHANGKCYEEDEENFSEDSRDTEEEKEEREATHKEENNGGVRALEQSKRESRTEGLVREMEVMLNEVFDAVSVMKRAYVGLQEAHCPWDPEKMRAADVAVVAELKRLGMLRERYRRSILINGGSGCERRGSSARGVGLREAVAPYEAVVDELKREVKARAVEVENLKEKLMSVTNPGGNAKKGRSFSRRKLTQSLSQGWYYVPLFVLLLALMLTLPSEFV